MIIETVDSKAVFDDDTKLFNIKETISVNQLGGEGLATSAGLRTGDILHSMTIVKENESIYVELDRGFKFLDAMLLVREGDSIIFEYTRGDVTTSSASRLATSNDFMLIP